MRMGIDAGGTLIKVAYMEGDSLQLKAFPSSAMEEVASWINAMDHPKGICITGGRAAKFKSILTHEAMEIVEFDATRRGVQYLLAKENKAADEYVLTNVGTGTSIHHVKGSEQQRIGGTGVGGGTLMGLSQLITGIADYDTIIQCAAKGTRGRVDLTVAHIYEGSEPPIPGDLTASNFGNSESGCPYTKEELLASVIGLVGETVSTVSVFAAGQCGVKLIVYIGSTFIENQLLKDVVRGYTHLRGAVPHFVENGQYSGAIGALLIG